METIFKDIHPNWMELFQENNLLEMIENTFKKISDFLNVYPEEADILKIFKISIPNNIKVVIIGQDPYHKQGQANGIAFSVNQGIKAPPSLRNIFKELEADLKITRTNTDLSDWVEQGILLINSCWTVEQGKPSSHANLGWENILIKLLNVINQRNEELIYCLWGNHAKKIYNNIRYHNGIVINSAHPSPFSYKKGFEGSRPFSKINKFLTIQNLDKIQW